MNWSDSSWCEAAAQYHRKRERNTGQNGSVHPSRASREEESRVQEPKRQPSWRDNTILAQDLCDKAFPTVKFIVPGLFPEGVVLLASRPKRGKSWLLQQLGSAVALGNGVLISPIDPDKPAHGDVLYLNLEDGERRAQRRMTKYFGSIRENWPERMTIARAWRRIDQGGLDDLRDWCKSVKQPTLIMVDTLKRVRPPRQRQQTDYEADYEACQGLIELCREIPGLVIIVAHHDRKMDADDVYDTVSGTLGLTGGVDTIALLKRTGQGITLHIQGRDLIEDVEKAVTFDRETCRWVILGEASEVNRSEGRAHVLAVLEASPTEMTAREIMTETNLGSQDAAYQLLHRMVKAGEIEKRGRGKYGLPGPANANDVTGVSGVSGCKEENSPSEPKDLDVRLCQEGCQVVTANQLSKNIGVLGQPDTPDIPDTQMMSLSQELPFAPPDVPDTLPDTPDTTLTNHARRSEEKKWPTREHWAQNQLAGAGEAAENSVSNKIVRLCHPGTDRGCDRPPARALERAGAPDEDGQQGKAQP